MNKIIASAVLCMGLIQAAEVPQTTGAEELTVRQVAEHVLDKAQTQVIDPAITYVATGELEKDADKVLNEAVKVEEKVETYIKEKAPKDKRKVEKKVKREKHKLLGKVGLQSKKKGKK